ncbi:quinone-dependent dihydroorotate dehydrogenase [Falsiroseomonas tokyonensis]|uniref:Dihydroorotate dehydrogenase (quinone) n=1 Tax=Falsiroseomonas tokyonensis TaxID=430521 RepID=A0ABV7BZZ3_9PROT|nr:quinone-dependent dihydroorotate dehydrogenase [Falsiroseomonas tokyonensis]MBU8540992.1 quinone-dependent dihydroorotate dehydrogenase [Falsiroseomonas tokyonensis]
MTPQLASVLMPLMRGMDPERAHDLALRGLRFGLAGADRSADDPVLATRALGLDFRNPIGLAAGFDKSAVAIAPLMRLGFGFVEAGSVTPKPQIGNPKPRLFRLAEDRAVINRMGMNNGGLAVFLARLAHLPANRPAVLGVNIAINKDGAAPLRDYPALYAAVAPHAGYVAINVSSPNTPGLRDLQGEAMLRDILAAVVATRDALAGPRPPILVKIAPDLSPAAVEPIVETAVAQGIAGLIVSNTTIARPALRSAQKSQAGGLSGPPLKAAATELLRRVARLTAGRDLTLIGCGGVSNGADALEKIRAGAALVQLYAAFAYDGPALIPRMKRELAAALRRDGFKTVAEAIGVDAR